MVRLLTHRDSLVERGMKEASISGAYSDMLSFFRIQEAVHRDILRCKGCTLHKSCDIPLPGTGSLSPEVLVVGDYPTEEEVKMRLTSFSEPSLYLLSLLHRLNIHMSDIHWTHAIKCPPEKVTKEVIFNCHHLLYGQIAALKPTVIVALGTTALTALLGEPMKVDDAIEQNLEFELSQGETIPIIAVKHPKSFLDKENVKAETSAMFKQLSKITEYID